jgi:hypothetical protein
MFSRGMAIAMAAASAMAGAAAQSMHNMGAALESLAERGARRIFGADAIRDYINRHGRTRTHASVGRSSIATGNRHIRNITTGQPAPHQHLRERARRLHPPGDARRDWYAAQMAAVAR